MPHVSLFIPTTATTAEHNRCLPTAQLCLSGTLTKVVVRMPDTTTITSQTSMIGLLNNSYAPMECNQQTAWTEKRNRLVASGDKAFHGIPTNSNSTLPRAAHVEGSMIRCHQYITSHSESAPASADMRPTLLTWSRMHAIHHPIPATNPP